MADKHEVRECRLRYGADPPACGGPAREAALDEALAADVLHLTRLALAMAALQRAQNVLDDEGRHWVAHQLSKVLACAQREAERAEQRVHDRMPCLRIEFSTQQLPASKFPELDTQLAGQQAGLNAMTVQQYLVARARFHPGVRDRAVARRARAVHSAQLQQAREQSLLAQQVPAPQARQRAAAEVRQRMRSLHALHNPDLVAGGRDEITGFGDGHVNSTIGRQWNQPRGSQPSRVQALDQAAAQVPQAVRDRVLMNGSLQRGDPSQRPQLDLSTASDHNAPVSLIGDPRDGPESA